MGAKEIADKYIRRDGRPPVKPRSPRKARRQKATVKLTPAEYKRLLLAAELDDQIVICEGCGAWIDVEEPAYCPAEDVTGCMKLLTGSGECVSHRSP